jgi:hypothetical protein
MDEPTDRQADEQAGTQAGEPVEESLVDSALEDTVLGLDHPPVTPAHHDEPAPEDADPSTPRSPRPPHGATS